MARRYLVAPLPAPGLQTLPKAVAHHLGTVLRGRAGDRVVLFDGSGAEVEAELREVGRRGVTAEVGEPVAVTREPRIRVTLAVALPKGARADWLFEHGTEVGVARFQPVIAERSALRQHNLERWRRIVAAAAGQCDRSHLPAIEEPLALGAFLEACGRGPFEGLRALADGEGEPLGPAPTDAVLLVGPEGGWTADERAAALGAGFAPRSLGPLTLRTETAALTGAAILAAGSA